jgi:hypothetical protein
MSADRIRTILAARGVDPATVDFSGADVLLRDDGDGSAIAFWNADRLGAEPSQTDIDAAVPFPPSYRDLRAVAYRDELGKDKGDFIRTLGDVLDVLIAEMHERGNAVTPEFGALLVKVAAIKAEFPK